MSDSPYIAAQIPDAFERERLALMGWWSNLITMRRLQTIGIAAGRRCLDVGAGDGAIARWMAQRVGSCGRVVATDINPRFLHDLDEPNVEVRRHDIVTVQVRLMVGRCPPIN